MRGASTANPVADSPLPMGFDRPHRSRVIDAILGGGDNYQVDSDVASAVFDALPNGATDARALLRVSVEFSARVCQLLAGRACRIRRFVICGTDVWASDPLYQQIHRIKPDAEILYVEPDVIMTHRALQAFPKEQLRPKRSVRVGHADIFSPTLLRDLSELNLLDASDTEPIGLVHCSTLPFIPPGSHLSAKDVVAGIIQDLPDRSFVALNHFCMPADDVTALLALRIQETLCGKLGTGSFLPEAEIADLFGDLPLVPPNTGTKQGKAVQCSRWYPPGPLKPHTMDPLVVGGLAHKGPPWPSW